MTAMNATSSRTHLILSVVGHVTRTANTFYNCTRATSAARGADNQYRIADPRPQRRVHMPCRSPLIPAGQTSPRLACQHQFVPQHDHESPGSSFDLTAVEQSCSHSHCRLPVAVHHDGSCGPVHASGHTGSCACSGRGQLLSSTNTSNGGGECYGPW